MHSPLKRQPMSEQKFGLKVFANDASYVILKPNELYTCKGE